MLRTASSLNWQPFEIEWLWLHLTKGCSIGRLCLDFSVSRWKPPPPCVVMVVREEGKGGFTAWYGMAQYSMAWYGGRARTRAPSRAYMINMQCSLILLLYILFYWMFDVVHLCIICDVVNTVKSSSVWPYEAIMPLQLQNGFSYRFCREQHQIL